MYRQFKLAISCAAACALGVTTATGAAAPAAHVAGPGPQGKAAYVVAKPAHSYRLSIAADKARLEKAQIKKKANKDESEEFGLVGGVSQSTLDAIASCESGGNPAAVDASGTYYGKYQFDMGTWARVGGSGSPAEASETEQDYRASLLYSQAGSSPWPVCGA